MKNQRMFKLSLVACAAVLFTGCADRTAKAIAKQLKDVYIGQG